MPPTNDANTAITNNAPEKEAPQVTQAERDEEAAFGAGFQDARGDAGEKKAGADDGSQGKTEAATTESTASAKDAGAEEAKRAKDEAERKAAEEKAAADAKRWEGVPPALREHIEAQARVTKEIDQRVKSVEGRAGAALSAVQSLKGAVDAASAASAAGRQAPSKEQIATANASSDKWKKLKEDFPDWADAMEEQFAVLRTDMGKATTAAPVDVEKLKREVETNVDARVAASVQTARALGRLDAEFGEWEETVNSEPFVKFTYAGGPTDAERSSYFETRKSDGAKAAQMFQGFATRYPQWWAEKGSLMASDSPKDAAKLLRGFGEHAKAEAARAEAARKKQERLEQAAPATRGTAAPTRTVESEEDAFAQGFKSVRG